MTIVIIEDSRTQRMKLEADLKRAGFPVIAAADGEAGIDACLSLAEAPAAVITDVVMPGIDGYEVCRRLKQHQRLMDVPIVVLTELSEAGDVLKAVEAGADNYCTKPYRVDQLLERLERAQTVAGDAPSASETSTTRLTEILVSSLDDAATRYHELELSRAELQRVNDQRAEMMRVVAHEVRTPLTALLVDATVAERNPAAVPALSRRVQRAVQRIVRVIGDLEDLSAIDIGRLSVDPTPVDLAQLVRSTVDRVQPGLPSHRVQLVRVEAPLEVLADADRIEQVLTNLLTNAAKYSPGRELIEVDVVRGDGHACVTVRDFGIGIAPAEQARVFERYFRTDQAKHRAEGLGIGLYVSARLVEAHGGHLSLDSHPGEGSAFTFRLPLLGAR